MPRCIPQLTSKRSRRYRHGVSTNFSIRPTNTIANYATVGRLLLIGSMSLMGLTHPTLADPDARRSLISNGDFEAARDGQPADWGLKSGATWEKEGANHFLRLKVCAARRAGDGVSRRPNGARGEGPGAEVQGAIRGDSARQESLVRRPDHDEFSRMRTRTPCSRAPSRQAFVGTLATWKENAEQFRVPAGAATLELMFTLFNAQSGQLDFDDIELTPIPVAGIDAAEAAAQAKESARIAALPRPKRRCRCRIRRKLPPALHVAGNQLQTPAGQSVWLQGVAIPSLEWSGGGEHILESIGVAIKDWKANCIRLPIRENFWSGHGPYQNDGGMKYRQLVDDAVNLCAGNGVYIVLDLHDFRAPTDVHVAFWKDIAPTLQKPPGRPLRAV